MTEQTEEHKKAMESLGNLRDKNGWRSVEWNHIIAIKPPLNEEVLVSDGDRIKIGGISKSGKFTSGETYLDWVWWLPLPFVPKQKP